MASDQGCGKWSDSYDGRRSTGIRDQIVRNRRKLKESRRIKVFRMIHAASMFIKYTFYIFSSNSESR